MGTVPTRTAILEAAEELFRDRGFAGARLVDITGRAGLTTGALYRHFPSKEALFGELFAALGEEGARRVAAADDLAGASASWLSTAAGRAGTLRAAFEVSLPGTDAAATLRTARDRLVDAFGPLVPGPQVPRPPTPGPPVPGPPVPGPGVSGAQVPGSPVPGPGVSGAQVPGPPVAARAVVDLLVHYALSASAGWVPRRTPEEVGRAVARLAERGLYADAETVPPASAEEIAARTHAPRPPFEPYIRWRPARDKDEPRYARGRRTLEAVQAAAIEVLADRGLAGTTVLDVAKAAGVSSGTVYRYFVDKEDIFRSLQASAEADIVRDTHLPLENGRLAIRGMLLAYFAIYRRHIALFRAWQELLQARTEMAQAWIGMRRRFIETAARGIRFGQRAGIADPDADPELVAELHSLSYEAVAYSRLILGWDGDVTDDAVAEAVERLFIGGFGT